MNCVRRGVIRSANNPTGDLAEHLFCKAFGWKQAGDFQAIVDASPSGRLAPGPWRRSRPLA